MRTGASVARGLFGQKRHRAIVVDVHPAVHFDQGTTMSVVGAFVEAHAGDHQKITRDSPDVPNRLLHDPVITQRGRAARVFMVRDSEKQDRREPSSDASATSSPSRSSESEPPGGPTPVGTCSTKWSVFLRHERD